MQGKAFFLNRFISRSNEWQCRYPALSAGWRDALSLSSGRQVVAATADADGIRCVFFSSLGSVLDFSASWSELENAKTWWHFTIRWNFWVLSDASSLVAMRTAGYAPADRKIAGMGAPVDRRCDKTFRAFLDHAEALFRPACRALLPHTSPFNPTHHAEATS